MAHPLPAWRELVSSPTEAECTVDELARLRRLYRQANAAETKRLWDDRLVAMLAISREITARIIVNLAIGRAELQVNREMLMEQVARRGQVPLRSNSCPQNRSIDSEDDSIF